MKAEKNEKKAKLVAKKLHGKFGIIQDSQTNKFKCSFKKFEELEDYSEQPDSINYFSNVGLDKFLDMTEVRSWFDWRAFAVAMLGLAQILVGIWLIA